MSTRRFRHITVSLPNAELGDAAAAAALADVLAPFARQVSMPPQWHGQRCVHLPSALDSSAAHRMRQRDLVREYCEVRGAA